MLPAAGVFVFAAGFLASPHPVTATTATNSIAANSCFMFDLLKNHRLAFAIGATLLVLPPLGTTAAVAMRLAVCISRCR